MANCKDCLHNEVCLSHCDAQHNEGCCSCMLAVCNYSGNAEKCPYFKDKNHFVELPCKIGDQVYVIDWCGKLYRGYNCPYGCSGGQREKVFRQECVKYCGIDSRGFSLDDVDRIGKNVFLTKAEAKNAIIERAEKNANH